MERTGTCPYCKKVAEYDLWLESNKLEFYTTFKCDKCEQPITAQVKTNPEVRLFRLSEPQEF